MAITAIASGLMSYGAAKLHEDTLFPLPAENSHPYVEYYDAKCRETEAATLDPLSEVDNPFTRYKSAKQPYQAAGKKLRDPDWCDLVAQHLAAVSGRRAAVASTRTMWLTFWGVVLLGFTLVFTKQTLGEAKDATKAAWAAAKAAEDTADQVAPFLAANNVIVLNESRQREPVFDESKGVALYQGQVEIHNMGKSVAHDIKLNARAYIHGIADGTSFGSWMQLPNIGENGTLDGIPFEICIPSERPIQFTSDATIQIILRLIYREASGTKRYTEAVFFHQGYKSGNLPFARSISHAGRLKDKTENQQWEKPPDVGWRF